MSIVSQLSAHYTKDLSTFLFRQLLVQDNDANIEKFFLYVSNHLIEEEARDVKLMKSYLMRIAPKVCSRFLSNLTQISNTLILINEDYVVQYIDYVNACDFIKGKLD